MERSPPRYDGRRAALKSSSSRVSPAVRQWGGRPIPETEREPGWDILTSLLAVMILTYVWRFQNLFPFLGEIGAPMLATLGVYGLFIFDQDPRRRLKNLKHPIMFLVLALLALMVMSVPGSLYPGGSYHFLTTDHIKTVIFTVLLVASARSFVDVKRMAAVHVFGGAIFSAIILKELAATADFRFHDAVFYDANDFALVAVCTLPLAVFFLQHGKGPFFRIATLLALLIITVGVITSASRGGFVGLLAVGAFMLVGFHAVPTRVRIGGTVLICLAFALVASEEYWTRMNSLLNPKEDYNWAGQAEEGRMEVWKRGMGYMLERPVLGVGVANFAVAEGTLAPAASRQVYGRGWKWSAAHNSFVQIGAELGVPGLLLFLALLTTAFLTLRRVGLSSRDARGRVTREAAMAQALTATLIGYAVMGFFLSQAYSAYLYTILAMVTATAKLNAGKEGVGRARTINPARAPAVTTLRRMTGLTGPR